MAKPIEAASLRRALRLISHSLNHPGDDWQRTPSREHLKTAIAACDKALVGAAGGDHLTEAAVALLLALELRERERLSGVEGLQAKLNEHRVR